MSVLHGRLVDGSGQLFFWCPGCDQAHGPHVPEWGFNGDFDKPTFTPSLLVYSHKTLINDELEGDALTAPENITETPRCHSFVTDGQIQFLDDCTHSLRGQTVKLPEWPLT